MSSRSPPGYCGANIVMFQSGTRKAGIRRSAARRTRTRGPTSTPDSRNRVLRPIQALTAPSLLLRFAPPLPGSAHDHVALHLLVQGRAEVGAVEREDALLVGLEGDGLGLPGIDDDVDVVVEDR